MGTIDFQPSRAVQGDDVGQRHRMSRAQLSMNWRQPIPAAATTQPQHNAPASGNAGVETAGKAPFQRTTETTTSPNYLGDPTRASNQSAVIPDSKNTSLWVTGLPRACATYSDLMDLLKGRGRILAASINDAPSRFRTAAATVTFFRHIDAENVMRAMNDGTLRAPLWKTATARLCTRHVGSFMVAVASNVHDDLLVAPEYGEQPTGTLIEVEQPAETTNQQADTIKIHACWNRVRVAERELRLGHVRERRQHRGCPQVPSRVIRVRGLPEWVEPASLEAYFNSKFRYDLDRVLYRGMTEHGLAEYEYRFACWKSQVPTLPFSPFFSSPLSVRFLYSFPPSPPRTVRIHIQTDIVLVLVLVLVIFARPSKTKSNS
ncbi:hypothetical protein F5Y14DRAFT_417397 [Nemania sp. NC0429]|nr:hypothetical protein F5Y14DRAFT_417397 [Nemania sp. NC0429]